ncbi:N-acetylglucosamine-6-phosphate deacetylase [Lacibacter cauensis]|uniref:N-acetylglucosamine-6-phosphate deacetylase n=1 Tax=Lacibacter cauensis TaxID=510947 RepID=A0A562SL40_9BACT|nr:N-acetylglucosamine-6-phosphate deacetylase [Lacibacter cauensis]TWI81654.1 N-acetylglucosamine-6-phosphate deacetylase [Lacibacter cauensis]
MRSAFIHDNNMQIFYNGTIFTGDRFINDRAVVVNNGIIEALIPFETIPTDTDKYDLQGSFLVPAFIDLQLYGGNGLLFSQALNEEAILATDAYCVSGGCTRFLLTLATNSIDVFLQGIAVAKQFLQQQNNTGLLGLHLEGPYINPVKRGAHLLEHIKQPTVDEVKLLLDKAEGIVKMMTLAPEQCSDEVLQLLIDRNVIVSAGHSNATYQQATAGFNKGITTATHLFNAMSPLQGREPGMVGAIYDHATAYSSIVCDGFHTSFEAVRISKKMMEERLFLITDAVTETTEGAYQHLLKHDRYVLPDGTLSGSALTMLSAVNNCIQHAGIEFDEALRMASLYPARVANLLQLGKIEEGFAADFTVLSKSKELKAVFRSGRLLTK